MKLFFTLIFSFGCIFLNQPAQAQLSQDGVPWSFTRQALPDSFQEIQIPGLDISALIKEDNSGEEKFTPPRFAKLIPVNYQPSTNGTWHRLPDGRKIWRLGIHLRGSLGISLFFKNFHLPQGAGLYIYSPDKKQVLGKFTSLNNRSNGLFATELILGDELIVELNLNANCTTAPEFTINEVSFAYADVYDYSRQKGFGGSDPCEVNVNCSPEGDNWQDEKGGVARIQVKIGKSLLWCSGSLVDNVRHDYIPYLLSADHCAFRFGNYATPEDLAMWVFYFNYESPTCENPITEPEHFSVTGAQWVANDGTHGSDGSDFYLMRLLDAIPYTYPVFYNGWSADDEISNSGVGIHHPAGDIMKISTYTTPLTTSGWQSNGLPSHWQVNWSETENNWGVTEGGSSGSPIFDEQGHLIGTLTGGLASCSNQNDPDYYGKFSYHWESNSSDITRQLKPWLDPDNTGITQINGSVSGISNNYKGRTMDVNIFPNPANNILNISFANHAQQLTNIEIYSLIGKIAYSSGHLSTDYGAFDISRLIPGIYFIKLHTEDYTFVKKIIKR